MSLNDNLVADRINYLVELNLHKLLAARLGAIKLKLLAAKYHLPVIRKYLKGFAKFSNGCSFHKSVMWPNVNASSRQRRRR